MLRLSTLALTAVLVSGPAAADDLDIVWWAGHSQPGAATHDHFGHAVAISGDWMLVGAYRSNLQNDFHSEPGRAYVFRRFGANWVMSQVLAPSDGHDDDRFGKSVAIDGERLIVGAPEDVGSTPFQDAGAAYVFELSGSTWTEVQKLTAAAPTVGAGFGFTVALSGDVAVVGEPELPGSVHVFERNVVSWAFVEELLPSGGPDDSAAFGFAVALDGERLIVGAQEKDWAGYDSGAAYVFERALGQFIERAFVVPSNGATVTYYGYSVAIDGERALVGSEAGTVAVLRRTPNTWVEEALLSPSDGGGDASFFGAAVALEGTLALVGAPRHDGPGVDAGAAYAYERQPAGWVELPNPTPGLHDVGDQLGSAAAVDRGIVVVGAEGFAPPADTGAAWTFRARGPLGVSECTANANSTGAAAVLSACGLPIGPPLDLLLAVEQLPPGQFGYFLAATGADFVPLVGGSQGNLCLALPIYRYALSILQAPASGSVELPLGPNTQPPGVLLDPGTTWRFQFWYRDLNPGPTSNFSQALAIPFE